MEMENTSVVELLNRTYNSIPFILSNTDVLPKPLSASIKTVFMVFFILIITLAFFGNCLVIYIVGHAKSKLTVTDMYIMSLAVSDLMISILNMPFQLNFFLTNRWKMGEFLCKFSNYMQGVTVTASILTLTVIAIDRYLVICRTVLSRRFHTKPVAGISITSLWIISLLVVCPQLMAQRVDMVVELDYSTNILIGLAELCREHFSDPELVTILVYVLVYLVPVIIMVMSYGAIAHRLWIQHPIGDMLENPRTCARSMQQKKKIIQMLMMLVVAFTVLWLPFFTAQLVEEFRDTDEAFRTWKAILQLVGYCNCCVNPIIYAFLNKTFQREFKSTCMRKIPLINIIHVNARSDHTDNTREPEVRVGTYDA